jgi:hypothetical protein
MRKRWMRRSGEYGKIGSMASAETILLLYLLA